MTEETIDDQTHLHCMRDLEDGQRALARTVQLVHKCVPRCAVYEFDYYQGTTHIGNTATMICRQCGEEWDITDYESW